MSSARPIARELVLLHWLMTLLIVTAVAGILARGWLPSGHAWRPALRNTHIIVGQLVFWLAIVRLVVRWRSPLTSPAQAPRLARWAARSVHGLLYGVMLAQPLTGLLFMQAGDKTVALFGLAWPQLISSDPIAHFALKDIHHLIGTAFYVLLALHVVAALWHHHVVKDHTLLRMLALRRQPAAVHTPPSSPGPTLAEHNALERADVATPERARRFGPTPAVPAARASPAADERHKELTE